MTLPFHEEIINDSPISSASFEYPSFVGFLSPYGIPISFRDKFGYTGHGQFPSIQEIFRMYYVLKIRTSKWISPLEKYIMSHKYQNSKKERYDKTLRKLSSSLKEEVVRQTKQLSSSFIYEQMEMDIYNFLLNCYSSDTFFDGVGNVETCMCEREFWKYEYKNKNLYDIDHYDFKMEYEIYKDKIFADVFKNVMIQYLGYHSVERVSRTITTSTSCIYETFYNYLLNDFTIFQIPKMKFNPEERKYVSQNFNEFFLPDSELRFRDEIQAIKKLVPRENRIKYYR